MRTVLIISCGIRTDWRYPVKYSESATSRSPSREASTTDASRASKPGGASPMGDPVPRLPPKVAPLRMSRDANCGNNVANRGIAPSSPRSISVRLNAAPRSMVSGPTVSSRNSLRRSIPMLSAVRACRMFTSTPQSVDPATSSASGCSASISRASPSEFGRTKAPCALVIDVAAGAGAGADNRSNSGSPASGSPRVYAASRIGR